jgi:osmotically-inducible protein OsmY
MEYKMTNPKFIAALLLSVVALNACAAPIIAAGAVGGSAGAASTHSGGLGQTFSDSGISNGIHDAWFNENRNMFDKLQYEVFEGRVMIVGSVQNAGYRDTAIRLAWQVPGVRQVINEIRVEPSGGITGYTKDSWIGTQFKTRLVTDGDISSNNYESITNNGVIYILGVARDQEELNLVLNHARNISYVKDVVSYVRLNGQDRPNEGSSKIENAPQGGSDSSAAPAPASTTSSSNNAVGYGSSNAPVADSDKAVGSSYSPPPGAADISSTDLAPVK